MKTRKPDIELHGPVASHNQACAVFHRSGESAVFDINRDIFAPSWKAQEQGFHLVHAQTGFQRFLLRFFK